MIQYLWSCVLILSWSDNLCVVVRPGKTQANDHIQQFLLHFMYHERIYRVFYVLIWTVWRVVHHSCHIVRTVRTSEVNDANKQVYILTSAVNIKTAKQVFLAKMKLCLREENPIGFLICSFRPINTWSGSCEISLVHRHHNIYIMSRIPGLIFLPAVLVGLIAILQFDGSAGELTRVCRMSDSVRTSPDQVCARHLIHFMSESCGFNSTDDPRYNSLQETEVKPSRPPVESARGWLEFQFQIELNLWQYCIKNKHLKRRLYSRAQYFAPSVCSKYSFLIFGNINSTY